MAQAALRNADADADADARFSHMTVKLGFGVDYDIAVMRSSREAVGDRAWFMADVNLGCGAADAIHLGRALTEFRLR